MMPSTEIEALRQNHIKVSGSQACQKANELIEQGEYKAAKAALGDLWQGLGVRPDLVGCTPVEQAEILLTTGVLTSWLGAESQFEGAQEWAKNLISESVEIYFKLSAIERWALAQCRLATCYWRTGEFAEARIIYQSALEREVEISPLTVWKLLMNLVNVEISTHYYYSADFLLSRAESLRGSINNELLLGNLFFHRALVQKCLAVEEGKFEFYSLALENYQKATQHYLNANNHAYCATVGNNTASILFKLGRYSEAHQQINNSLDYYLATKVKGNAGSVYDTRAQVYLAEGELAEAEKAALSSVNILRDGDEYSLLADSLITLGTIFARRGAALKAQRAYDNAFTLASRINNQDSAGNALLSWLEELGPQMPRSEFEAVFQQVDELFANTTRITALRRLKTIARQLAKQYASGCADIVINLAPVKQEYKTPSCGAPEETKSAELAFSPGNWQGFNLKAAVNEFEARYISRALQETNGNLTRAAGLLGLSHQNLSLQLKLRHQGLAVNKKPRKKRTVVNNEHN